MQPIHFFPPEILSAYIAFYGVIDTGDDFMEPFILPPLGLCGLIITLEGKLDAHLNGKPFMVSEYCATGQITSAIRSGMEGKHKLLLVFIQPCGLHQLFGLDMSELTNTSVPLSDLLGKERCGKLIQDLKSAEDHPKIIEVINEVLIEQLPATEVVPKVKKALDYIHSNKGNVSIKDIERNCFITTRSLERHFKMLIGLSPKEYSKIYQFKNLLNCINENPGITWTKLCRQNGFYDQSHLTRYSTRYLNAKPNELAAMDMEYIGYLLQN